MTEESTTDVLDKYIKLKEEYDALKVKMGGLEQAKADLATSYETAKGEIVSLQRIIATHVVATESDNPPNKPQTLKELFKYELDKNRK